MRRRFRQPTGLLLTRFAPRARRNSGPDGAIWFPEFRVNKNRANYDERRGNRENLICFQEWMKHDALHWQLGRAWLFSGSAGQAVSELERHCANIRTHAACMRASDRC